MLWTHLEPWLVTQKHGAMRFAHMQSSKVGEVKQTIARINIRNILILLLNWPWSAGMAEWLRHSTPLTQQCGSLSGFKHDRSSHSSLPPG